VIGTVAELLIGVPRCRQGNQVRLLGFDPVSR